MTTELTVDELFHIWDEHYADVVSCDRPPLDYELFRAVIAADRARQAPAPVEVSRLAEASDEVLFEVWDDHYADVLSHDRPPLDYAFMRKILALASTPVGEVPACPKGCGTMGSHFSGWRCNACGSVIASPAPAASKELTPITPEMIRAMEDKLAASGNQTAKSAADAIVSFLDAAASKGAEAVAWYEVQTPGADFDISFVQTMEEALQLNEGDPDAASYITPLYEHPAAPSEPEAQKAVAEWVNIEQGFQALIPLDKLADNTKLYASPSPAASMEVQGLTDDELHKALDAGFRKAQLSDTFAPGRTQSVIAARAAMSALVEKNGWRLGEGQ